MADQNSLIIDSDAIGNQIASAITQAFNDTKQDSDREGVSALDPSLSVLGEDILEKVDQILDGTSELVTEKNFDEKLNTSTSALNEILEAVKTIAGVSEDDTGGGEENGSPEVTPTNKTGVNDIKDLSLDQGLGFSILYWKLDEISGKMGEDKDDHGGKKLGNFFSGLLKGAAAIGIIAVALAVFAGALGIFSMVSWMPALAGLLSFGVFITGFLVMAKFLGKELKSIQKFALACLEMSGALGLFGVSIYIVSQVFSGQPVSIGKIKLPPMSVGGALLGLTAFAGFTLALLGLSKLVKGNKKNFADFGKGAMVMSAALGFFALGMVVVAKVFGKEAYNIGPIHIPAMSIQAALLGVGSFMVFGVTVGLMAKLTNKGKSDYKKLALTSIVMTGALAVFALGMVMVGSIFGPGFQIFGINLKADLGGSIAGILEFTAFTLAVILLTKLANGMMMDIIKFTGVSVLMSAALAAFSIGVGLTAIIAGGGGGQIGPFKIDGNVNFGTAMAGLGMFTIFIAAFAAMSLGLTFAGPFIAPGMLVLLGMAGVICALGGAFALLASVLSGGSGKDENGNPTEFKPLSMEQIDYFFEMTAALVEGFSEIKFFKAAAALAKAVVITPLSLLVSAIAGCLMLVGKATAKLEETGGIGPTEQMFADFNDIILRIDEIDFDTAKKAKKNAKQLKPIAKTVKMIADCLIKVNEATADVDKNGGMGHMEMFKTFTDMIIDLGNAAAEMSDTGYYAANTISTVYRPLVDCIWMMVDIIDKMAQIDPKDGDRKELIPQAMSGLREIVGTKNTGFLGMFNYVVDNIEKVSGKAKRAIEMLEPMTAAVADMVWVVQKTNEIDVADITNADAMLFQIKDFMLFLNDAFVSTEIEKDAQKNLITVGEMVRGEEDFEGVGLCDIFKALGEATNSVKGLDFNQSYYMFTNLMNGLSLFQNLPTNAVIKFQEASRAIENFNPGNFASEMKGFMKAMNNLNDTLAKSNPFDTIQEGIMNTTNGLHSLNEELAITINKVSDLADASKQVGALQVAGASPSAPSGGKPAAAGSAQPLMKSKTEEAIKDMAKIIQHWDKNGIPLKKGKSSNRAINF